MREISIRTSQRQEMHDITAQVKATVRESGIKSGSVVAQSPHTTPAVTVNENADRDVQVDLLGHLSELIPQAEHFRHQENNSDSHIKVSLVGPSVTLIVDEGEVQLGTWQGIYAAEFDGPRSRQLWLHVSGSS